MKSQTLKLMIAWLLVGSALGWGVVQSIKKSMPLFQVPAAKS